MYFTEAPCHTFMTKGGSEQGEMAGAFEIAAELFRPETIFNFHVNNFHMIIGETNIASEQYFY